MGSNGQSDEDAAVLEAGATDLEDTKDHEADPKGEVVSEQDVSLEELSAEDLAEIAEIFNNEVKDMTDNMYVVVENRDWNWARPANYKEAKVDTEAEETCAAAVGGNSPLVHIDPKVGIPQDVQDDINDYVDELTYG